MMKSAKRGRFVTLEGGEGAGKSTQLRLLGRWLENMAIPFIATREPGGTVLGEKIRYLLLKEDTDTRTDAVGELLLLLAARRHHFITLIEPALQQGLWVLCDRFQDSTMAYQGAAMGINPAFIRQISNLVLPEEAVPDLTFVLDIAPLVGLARTRGRDAEEIHHYENMLLDVHLCIRDCFDALVQENPQRMVTINAERSIEAIQKDLRRFIEARFLPGNM
ncbi:MAG: dTMP kinase [Alphaproteobacteria bacterium]